MDGASLMGTPRPRDDVRPVFDWADNVVRPPEGSNDGFLNGAEGFARVLGTTASPTLDPGDSRLYRIGPDGGLVGSAVEALVDPVALPRRGSIRSAGDLERVDPESLELPWILES